MHRDFLTALWHGESCRSVYQRLCFSLDEAWRAQKAELWEDVELTDHIKAALREPIGSAPHSWAESFMREAEEEEKKKPPLVIRMEKRRRQIEAEHLRLMAEENERMKKKIAEAMKKEEEED